VRQIVNVIRARVKIPTPVSLQKLVDSIGLASKFKGCNPRGKTKKILGRQFNLGESSLQRSICRGGWGV